MKNFIVLSLTLVSLFLADFAFAQTDRANWIGTEGTIKELKTHRSGRKKSVSAVVTYTTKEGKTYDGQVRLIPLPILGSLKKEGDKIKVFYDPNQPAAVETATGSFLEKYGMYLLIGLGVLFSLGRIRSMMKGQKQETT